MKISRLGTLVFVILFTTGCQQTQMSASKPLTDNSAPALSHQLKTAQPKTDLAGIEAGNQNSANQTAPACETGNNDVDTPAKDTKQKRIDQALELCNMAQNYWEKGNLEEALSSLDSAYFLILEIDHHALPELSQQKEDIRYLISKRILEIYASRQIVVTGRHEAIPVTMNRHVQNEIKRLTGPERKFLIQSLERSSLYRPYIVQELKKAGLPEEISWLPLIESGFKIRALSSARALGLWQFIPSTGHKFGLSRNYYIDERMDPEKATQAAIAYLKELHNLFGDWTTALAAYNCGEFRVLKTIRRQKINYLDNFWDLYQSLPRETAKYVPRFLATVHIVNNLEKYNITIKSPQVPIAYKKFDIKKQVRLKDIAKEIHVSTKQLVALNPELRHALLPPETYSIKIPAEQADLFLARLDKIKTTYTPPPMYVYHRVRRGDTLSGIAKKYRTSVKTISRCNKIYKNHRIIAGKVLKIPTRNYPGGSYSAASSSKTRIPAGQSVKYKVRRGDNLWLIAKKFSTTTKQIMVQNQLSGTTLHIGQTLTISSGKAKINSGKGAGTYRVKSGDSPFLIAKKHKMTLNRLLALNHLNKRSKIYPGQKLIVE
ncbi:MAG: LysM peptidoglycan-binding domain-containing protein [Desulfobacter sp.]|nr:LysM peptidoglycan-binding domain-containing protein [Desulfobacter sp.]